MAYTDDAVLAKLSALNETHDSIATAAQWIMFHRRHAEKTVQLWFQRLKDSPSPKRLNLVYLANEVTQQSKARHKEDFVVAFSPVIAEAIASAYKGAPSDVQSKLRRVVDVWRDRSIFEVPIQSAVESRIDELDKTRGTPRTGLGGSIFGSNAAAFPPELAPLVPPQQKLTKMLMSTQSSISKANSDYEKTMNNPSPAAPVHAARLNGLQKTIVDAEQAVQQLIKARSDLKAALDKLQTDCQAALDADMKQLEELERRRQLVDTNKQEVEDRILKGLNAMDTDLTGAPAAGGQLQEPPRPEVEALTPPPMEALTPPAMEEDGPDSFGAPKEEPAEAPPAAAGLPGLGISNPPPPVLAAPAALTVPTVTAEETPAQAAEPKSIPSASGMDILSHLASQAIPVSTNGANKRRRVDDDGEVPDLDDGIDADVAETLRKDSQAA